METFPNLVTTTLELLTAAAHPPADSPDGKQLYTFRARTTGEDRNKNTTEPGGWELAPYMANPVVFARHIWSEPIGKAHRVWMSGDILMAQLSFGDTQEARHTKDLVDQDLIRALSAGWVPLDADLVRDDNGWPVGIHSRRQELVELSIVPLPADKGALRVASSQPDPFDGILDALRAVTA